MKKTFLSAMLLMALSIGFVSCSGDDDDSIGGGSASATTGVLDGLNKRVKSVGDYTFYYKDNGLLDYIRGKNSVYEFTYNPNKIVYTENRYGDYGLDDIVVTYNGSGYISRVDMTHFEEIGGKTTKKWQETSFYAYDNSGYLISVEGLYKKGTYEGTYSLWLTWENNLLLSVKSEDTLPQDSYDPCHHHIYTYSYENAYHNKYHQYVPSVLRFLDIHIRGVVELLACVGLLGKGPLYLPANCITTGLDETGEEYYSDKRNFSYGLNSDGSIYYSSLDYFLGYHFEYEYLNNVDRAAVATW